MSTSTAAEVLLQVATGSERSLFPGCLILPVKLLMGYIASMGTASVNAASET